MKTTNKAIFGIIAKFLGKDALAVKDGKVELTADEKEKIRSTYGDEFLKRLEAADASSEDATGIFNAMVESERQNQTLIATLQKEKKELQESVNTLSAAAEAKPGTVEVPAGASKEQTFNIVSSARHNALAAQALASGAGFGAAMAAAQTATLDPSEVNTEFGTVMPAGTRIQVLSQRIYNGFNDAKYFRKITSNTDYKATAAIMTEVSQQFVPKWTPKGSAKFTPVVIKYRRHKINVLLNATDILTSWLSYLYEQGKTQAEMPIIKYMIEQHVLPKVTDDIVLSMVGKGSFVDHNDGTATDGTEGFAAKDSMDGYETILVKGLTDPKCKFNFFKNALDYRTLTDQQLLKYVDDFVDAISPLFARIFNIYCSPEFLTAYRRADFAVNGKYTGDESDGKIRFTKFSLVALDSMYASPIIFATPAENLVMLVDYAKAESCINQIQVMNYDVKVFGEYSLSVGFLIAEAVYAAIPANYTPSEAVASSPETASNAWKHGEAAAAPGNDTESNDPETA